MLRGKRLDEWNLFERAICSGCKPAVVESLIPEMLCKVRNQSTFVELAARPSLVTMLLDANVSCCINSLVESSSLLHCAAEHGNAAVCAVLLDSEDFTMADAQHETGCTALHEAARQGDGKICSLLLHSEMFTASDTQDGVGWTALHSAASN